MTRPVEHNHCETCKFRANPSINDLVPCSWPKDRIDNGPVPKRIPSDWEFPRLVCYPNDSCDKWEPKE